MEQVNGVIDNIYTKTVSTQYGDKQVYHAEINGVDVNLGFKCDYAEGEQVTLPVEHKYGSYQLVKDGKGTVSNSNSVAKSSNGPATKPATKAFPTPEGTKDVSIIRQNSMRHAVIIVDNMVASGVLTLNSEQEYVDKVLEVAYTVTDFSTGWREVKMAKQLQEQ